MSSFTKAPDDVLDYDFNYIDADPPKLPFLATGETIATATVTVATGLTKDSHSIVGGKVVIWLSGGTLGQSYRVDCEITTNQGRTIGGHMTITIRDR